MFPRHGFSSAAGTRQSGVRNVEVVGEPATEARTFTYESEEDGNYSTSTDLGGIQDYLHTTRKTASYLCTTKDGTNSASQSVFSADTLIASESRGMVGWNCLGASSTTHR